MSLLAHPASAQDQLDPTNPTCPAEPNWSNFREMRLTVQQTDGGQVLLAEGAIDINLIPRLREALAAFSGEEVWLRSPGGNARVGNEAGRLIRDQGLSTRIPSGWACYGACNFMFMGGLTRSVDSAGLFMVKIDPPFNVSDVDPAERRALADQIAQTSAQMASEDFDFLIRMGISRALLSDIMYRSSQDGSTRRCLTRAELLRYNVINPARR